MVVMAAVPPDSGVGCMTPNWTLLAALEEALCRACGAGGYELFVAPVAEEDGGRAEGWGTWGEGGARPWMRR